MDDMNLAKNFIASGGELGLDLNSNELRKLLDLAAVDSYKAVCLAYVLGYLRAGRGSEISLKV